MREAEGEDLQHMLAASLLYWHCMSKTCSYVVDMECLTHNSTSRCERQACLICDGYNLPAGVIADVEEVGFRSG